MKITLPQRTTGTHYLMNWNFDIRIVRARKKCIIFVCIFYWKCMPDSNLQACWEKKFRFDPLENIEMVREQLSSSKKQIVESILYSGFFFTFSIFVKFVRYHGVEIYFCCYPTVPQLTFLMKKWILAEFLCVFFAKNMKLFF